MPGKRRLAWIDWLKAIVVVGVFAYHAAQPFLLAGWIVVDDEKSVVLSALAGFGYLFGMPLMFLLAGAASWTALQYETAVRYLAKRLRLILPLGIGILALGPLQGWIGALSNGDAASLPRFAVEFWGRIELEPTPTWFGRFGYHLWFIGFLLVYAVASVPILVRLARPSSARRRLGALAYRHPTALLLLPIGVLLASQLLLRVPFPGYQDWADFALWFLCFVAGAAMLAWPSVLRAVRRRGVDLAAPGALMAAALAAIYASGLGFELERSPGYDLAGLGYIGLRTAAGWCWIVVALAMASRWLDRRPVAARTASGLVLPFYVLHHPIVVAVAAVVVPSTAGVAVEFLIILGVSLAVTLGACLAVDRTPLLRVLLGMASHRVTETGASAVSLPPRQPKRTVRRDRAGAPVTAGR